MGDISPNFNRSEFACKCGQCGFDTVDAELLEVLEHLREAFDAPVTISSGCRCATHNKNEGGSDKSQHLYGRAADIKVQGATAELVYNYLDLKYPLKYGMGEYSSWVHIDTRTDGPARW